MAVAMVIIILVWLLASLIVYMVMHWQAVLAVMFFGGSLFFVWWLAKPVVFERFYLALVHRSVGLARLKHRGLARIAITRTRLRPYRGRHEKGYHRAPGS